LAILFSKSAFLFPRSASHYVIISSS
jgi:hypothetical protein